jgi:choline dehydrogenase-like flavoprotein
LQETGNATGFFTPARAVDPRSGTRSSSLTGYFEPNADRKNLVVLTGAEATKVLFKTVGTQDKKTPRVAEAVEFVSGGKKYKVKAKREVVLSAGAPSPFSSSRWFIEVVDFWCAVNYFPFRHV